MSRDNLFGLDVNRIAPGDYVIEGHWEVKDRDRHGDLKVTRDRRWSAESRKPGYSVLYGYSFQEIKRLINATENRRG